MPMQTQENCVKVATETGRRKAHPRQDTQDQQRDDFKTTSTTKATREIPRIPGLAQRRVGRGGCPPHWPSAHKIQLLPADLELVW